MDPLLQEAIGKADEVLKENFVTAAPVLIEDIARNYGLETKQIAISDQSVAGFIDAQKQTIYVQESDIIQRKVFTIAHELGHWLMHRAELEATPEAHAILYRRPLGAPNADPVERQANCFAANLLVPTPLLKEQCERPGMTPTLLAGLFSVSPEVIGFRLKDVYGRDE